jgi:hypothetical protein
MKLIARLFLFLFIAFLSTPAVLVMIDKSVNTSKFFNVSEEEKVQKEVAKLAYVSLFQLSATLSSSEKKAKIPFVSVVEYDKISRIIFSPPPNLV